MPKKRLILTIVFVFAFIFAIISVVGATLPLTAKAADIPLISRDSIIAYAETGVGSPYVWGGDTWDPNNRLWGGADCSGFVLKAWQIPRSAAYTESVGHPYNTYNFFFEQTYWYPIGRDELQRGDMLVYRDSSGGHSVIYHYGDKWGKAVVYEARSKKTGIVHGESYIPTYFQARRRRNLVDADNLLLASVKQENGTFIDALKEAAASSNLYFDYFGQSDVLSVQNADTGFATQVNANLVNNSLLESRSVLINPLLSSGQLNGWKQNAYMNLVSGGQKMFAKRITPQGFSYYAKDDKMLSSANFVDYFELRNDTLYLTNPNTQEVSAAVYLMNDGKIYNRKVVKIAPTSVSTVNYKKSRLKARLKVAFVRVNTKGGRIFVSKKTSSSYLAEAAPLFKLSRLLFVPNFEPSKNILYIANPNAKKVSLSVRYVAGNKTFYIKQLTIEPKDVIAVDERKRLNMLGEVLLKIRASASLLASKKSAGNIFQLAQPDSAMAQVLYVTNFNPSKELLYLISPVSFAQKAQVNVFSDGINVYSVSYDIFANSQMPVDLTTTSAAQYSNTYVQIVGSL